MIRPKPKPSAAGPRSVAVILTAALLVGAQAGLQGLPVPAFASGRSVIRELDPLMLERFAVPPAPTPEDDTPSEEVAEPEEPASVSFDQEVGRAMEQLEELFTTPDDPAAGVDRADAGEPEPGAPGIAEDVPAERFESLFGAGADALPARPGARRSGGGRADATGGGGLGIGIEERPVEERSAPSPAAQGPAVAVPTGTARAAVADGGELRIGTQDAETFDESAADRLGRWMRANPAELPVGVRVHMNYEPSFLTAATVFHSDERSFELFLMYNESLREVHVVLVEGNRSVYLIDRGFQEQSRSLREGTVRRSGGSIVAVDSRSGAASSARSQEFYDVFLSWWTAVDGGAP